MNVSASGLQHVARCPGSRHLKQYDHTNQGAKRGSSFHKIVEIARHQGKDAALQAFEDNPREAIRPWVYGFDFESFAELVGEAETEVAYAWDSETSKVRHLGTGIERDYGDLKDTEVPGTVDYQRVEDTHGVLVDLKTGRTWVPDPEYNWQMRFGALCLALCHGLETVEAHIVQVEDDGASVYKPAAYWTVEELIEHGERLTQILAKDNLVTGDHCKWCDAYASCPAIVGTVTSIVEYDTPSKELTAETVAEVYPRLMAAKKAVDRVEKAIKGFVEFAGPVPLGDGKKLDMVPGSWTKVSAAVAVDVIRELAGEEAAQQLGAGLQSAVKYALKDTDLDPQEVLDEIEKRGGMTKLSKRPSMREVKA